MTVSFVPLHIPAAQMDFGTTPQNGPASWQNRFVNTRLSTLQVSAPGLEYSVPVCDDGDDMCTIHLIHRARQDCLLKGRQFVLQHLYPGG